MTSILDTTSEATATETNEVGVTPTTTTEASSTTTETPTTSEQANWYDGLNEETLKTEGFDGIKDKFKSMDEVALAYVNAQKLIGKKTDAKSLPTKDSEKSDWDSLYNELGRPEDPAEYKMPEDIDLDIDSELLVGRNKALHDLGLNQNQYDGIMSMYAEEFGRIEESFIQNEKQVVRDTEASLQEEWGNKYDANIKTAAKAAEKFGIKEQLMESGLINHLPVIQMLHKVGDSMNEDGIVKTPDSGYSRADELKTLRNSKAFLDRGHVDHEKVYKRLQELYK